MPAHQITAEETKWAIIYPVYVDAKKSRAAGRRVGVEKACDNPTANEIVDVCHGLKLEAFAEVCQHIHFSVTSFIIIIHLQAWSVGARGATETNMF